MVGKGMDASAEAKPVQAQIEEAMQAFCDEERWESIFLFSSEGLLMARCGRSESYGQENLLEFVFALKNVWELLDDDLPAKEITVRGMHRRTLVFQGFMEWGERLTLAAVLSGRKGYRRAMRRLMKRIHDLG